MQFMTWFSRWIKLFDGDELVEVGCWSKLRWIRCNARRALSSWASLSSSTNFSCSEEGDGGGVGLWLGIEVWSWNLWFMFGWDWWLLFWYWVWSSKGSFGRIEWDECGSLLVRVIVRLSCWAKRVVSFGWSWKHDEGMDESDSSCVDGSLDVVCGVITMMLGLLGEVFIMWWLCVYGRIVGVGLARQNVLV